jgi:hypothetical protein
MFLVDFLQHLKRYGRDRLPELMIKTSDSGEAKYVFVFVPHDRDGVDLMLGGERLGSVKWVDGEMLCEPPIEFSERLSFDGHLDQWVSRACQNAGVTAETGQGERKWMTNDEAQKEAIRARQRGHTDLADALIRASATRPETNQREMPLSLMRRRDG